MLRRPKTFNFLLPRPTRKYCCVLFSYKHLGGKNSANCICILVWNVVYTLGYTKPLLHLTCKHQRTAKFLLLTGAPVLDTPLVPDHLERNRQKIFSLTPANETYKSFTQLSTPIYFSTTSKTSLTDKMQYSVSDKNHKTYHSITKKKPPWTWPIN